MVRTLSLAAALLITGVLVASIPPSFAQSSADLEKKIAELTRRVEALEKKLQPAKRASRPAKANNALRQKALALHGEIDKLVAGGKIDEANQALTAFNEEHAGAEGAGLTRSLTRELAVVGKPVPRDWSIEKWYQGESDVKLNGKKPILVVFWESWCGHCRREVPRLQKVHDDNKAKGLRVLGLTRLTKTATEETVKSFISESGVGYPIAKVAGDLADHFNVKGIPAAAVVKDGKIVWRGHPMRLNDELLANWL